MERGKKGGIEKEHNNKSRRGHLRKQLVPTIVYLFIRSSWPLCGCDHYMYNSPWTGREGIHRLFISQSLPTQLCKDSPTKKSHV